MFILDVVCHLSDLPRSKKYKDKIATGFGRTEPILVVCRWLSTDVCL